jgi:Protein of unknown function (DUF1566)/Viral BACON domain
MKKTCASAFGFIIFLMVTAVAFAAPVTDTGQTKCYNASVEIPCPSSGQPFYGQDAQYSINPMSYTKLDGSGNALSSSATSWVMIKDNVTGLIWENKTVDGTIHDKDNKYAWSRTGDFIKALNDAHYGGYSDWRMPTIKELAYIVNYSIPQGTMIDTGYFPNTQPSGYWSSTASYYPDVAWVMSFGYGSNYGRSTGNSYYVRAVRGGQSGVFGGSVIGSFDAADSVPINDATASTGGYTNNGNGTVTDEATGLMWQQETPKVMTWEQALAYCVGLNLGSYTDWRLPTIKELISLVDLSRYNPAINTTYFSNAVSSFYWSSTTNDSNTLNAWGMPFYLGYGDIDNKSLSYYVRAVRGGQSGSLGNLVISPASRNVPKDAGTTTFSVSNTGTRTMQWTAAVTASDSWLSITSGVSGTDTGTINCSFTANTSTSSRTGTIRVTASGATGSPIDVTVTQAPAVCTATLDGNLKLFIPVLSYLDQSMVKTSYWAYFVYEYNPTYPTLILFKYTDGGSLSNPSCAASTLSSNLKINIPDVQLPDRSHLWMDLDYSPLSTDGNAYFVVTKYGVISN